MDMLFEVSVADDGAKIFLNMINLDVKDVKHLCCRGLLCLRLQTFFLMRKEGFTEEVNSYPVYSDNTILLHLNQNFYLKFLLFTFEQNILQI